MKQRSVAIHREIANGREVTLVATPRVLQWKGKRKSRQHLPHHVVNIGYAVKNPGDTGKKELGEIIAAGRSTNKPTFALYFQGQFLPKELVDKILLICADEFEKRFTNYVPFSPKGQRRLDGKGDGQIQPREVESQSGGLQVLPPNGESA